MSRLSFRYGQELCPICLSVDDLTIRCANCHNTVSREGSA